MKHNVTLNDEAINKLRRAIGLANQKLKNEYFNFNTNSLETMVQRIIFSTRERTYMPIGVVSLDPAIIIGYVKKIQDHMTYKNTTVEERLKNYEITDELIRNAIRAP